MKLISFKDLYFLSVIVLVKTVSLSSSLKLRKFVASSIAFAAYRLSRNKRRLSEKNVFQAFDGKLRPSQIRRIVKQSFYEFWHDTLALLPSRRERDALKRVEFRGLEHLQGALRNKKGVILWESSFFGRRFLAKQLLHRNGFAIHQVHNENHLGGLVGGSYSASWVRGKIIKRFFEKCEKQFLAQIIYLPSSDSLVFTRVLLQRLKQNAIVCIAGDGKFGRKFIPVKFLDRMDVFATGMVSLAKTSGAAILPLFCVQESEERTSIIIESPIRMDSHVNRERRPYKSIMPMAQYFPAGATL